MYRIQPIDCYIAPLPTVGDVSRDQKVICWLLRGAKIRFQHPDASRAPDRGGCSQGRQGPSSSLFSKRITCVKPLGPILSRTGAWGGWHRSPGVEGPARDPPACFLPGFSWVGRRHGGSYCPRWKSSHSSCHMCRKNGCNKK